MTLVNQAVIIGAPRTGTTLLASILSKAGLYSGIKDKPWDPAGGYYEHPLLISCSRDLQNSERLAGFSNSLSRFYRKKAFKKISQLPSDVLLLKFPNFSYLIPPLIQKCGRQPICIVAFRRFSSYAISYYKLNKKWHYDDIKKIYLRTYHQCLLLRHAYPTYFVSYEDICSFSELASFTSIESVFNLQAGSLSIIRDQNVRKSNNNTSIEFEDHDCDYLYDLMSSY